MRKPREFNSNKKLEKFINRKLRINEKRYDFGNSVFNIDLKFVGYEFDSEVLFDDCIFNYEVDFSQSKFADDLDLSGATFFSKVSFWETNIKGGIRLRKTRFIKEVDLSQSRIEGDLDAEDSVYFAYTIFLNTSFNNAVNFKNTLFFREVDFEDCLFRGRVDFTKANFCAEASFCKVEFFSITDFWKANFLIVADFQGAEFLKTVDFTGLNKDVKRTQRQLLELQHEFNSFFSKEITVNKECKFEINLCQAKIEDTAHFDEVYVGSLNLESFRVRVQLTLNKIKVKNANRETFRILKDQLLKQNNRIEALKYYKREMNEQLLGCLYSLFPFTLNEQNSERVLNVKENMFSVKLLSDVSLKEVVGNFFEVIALMLHRISNSHGTSWGRGLLFFLLSTLFFYTLFMRSLEGESDMSLRVIDVFFYQYWHFINPTHKFNFLIPGFKLGYYSLFIDFLGRIFSSYGIYQVVQAFRKYGKN